MGRKNAKYLKGVQGTDRCPKGSEVIDDEARCRLAATKFGAEFAGMGSFSSSPKGCLWSTDGPKVWLNARYSTSANAEQMRICEQGGKKPDVWWAEEVPGYDADAEPVVDNNGCKTARLGTSGEHSKTIDMPDEYKCPKVVSKANWDKYAAGWAANVDDSMSTSQSGGKLTVTRRNSDGGWGMNLEFQCCKGGADEDTDATDAAAPASDDGPQCMTADLGSSGEHSKTIDMADEYKCPQTVSKSNWDKGAAGWAANVGDTMSTSQSGGKLTVTRNGYSGGWGMNLKFKCCKSGTTVQGSLAMADPVPENPPLLVSMFAVLGFVITLYGAFKHYTKE